MFGHSEEDHNEKSSKLLWLPSGQGRIISKRLMMLVNNLKYFFNKTLFVIYIYIYITFTWAYFDEGEKSQR